MRFCLWRCLYLICSCTGWSDILNIEEKEGKEKQPNNLATDGLPQDSMYLAVQMIVGNTLYCLPQDCLLVGNPEVGISEFINNQGCLP